MTGQGYKITYNTTGLNNFLSEMGQSAKKAKGGSFTLKTLNNKWGELTEGGYKFARFEGNIPDIETGHKLDALFINLNNLKRRSIECKNWKTVSSIKADETSQFYQYVKSGNEFRYYFNGNTNEAKKAFQNIFKNREKAKIIFDANTEMFKKVNISDDIKLSELASQGKLINHPVFNFIR